MGVYVNKENDILEQTKIAINKINYQYDVICNIRMVIGIIGFIFIVLSIINRNLFYLWLFISACIAYVIMLSKHEKLSAEREFMIGKYDVLLKRYERLNHKWNRFRDNGEEFLTDNSNAEKDLDIFGKDSLFQFLCVANTKDGKERLAAFLTEGNPNFDVLRDRQKAVQELMENKELSLNLEIYSMIIGNEKENTNSEWYDNFMKYISLKKKLFSKAIGLLSIVMPVITLITCFFSIKYKMGIKFLFILVIMQLCITSFISYKNKKVLQKVFSFCRHIGMYSKILDIIEKAEFKSDYLRELQNNLVINQKATRGIAKLYSLNEFFQVQHNSYVHIILQGIVMYDIQCIRMLEKWKKIYSENIFEWFRVIGDIEALLSLSMIGLDRNVTFPIFREENQPLLDGKEMIHPLIASDKAVANSIRLRRETGIITGSNMSGKTTFLRTLGINVVLAYAGAPVLAKSLQLSEMKLFTSMRVADDVSKGISTFYAEVKRIKEMADFSKKRVPMLILIDEIFKGTNSADRIVGAKEVIRKLSKSHTILLVSTHDFELCDLIVEKNVTGQNYHFQEYYQEDKLCFDYKIRSGKCQTTNAKYILRMAGLID